MTQERRDQKGTEVNEERNRRVKRRMTREKGRDMKSTPWVPCFFITVYPCTVNSPYGLPLFPSLSDRLQPAPP